ncbi:hypothetical protein [Rhizosaccharibacter radicis]|uniref:Lipoprotein n=1 Tax=Rhizosaccharibacter radicis TaxID=2782605 RepID=A0ABT1W1G1_9PROT|nr:hypothetical protein [Acetobacteraceae bacterium KSS12]
MRNKHRSVRFAPGGRVRAATAIALAAALGACTTEGPVAGTGSPGAAPGYGYVCYAGVYQCRVPTQVPLNSPCSCPGIGAPSFGTVR